MTRTLKRAVLACTLVLAACSSPPATTSQSSFSYLGEVQFPSGFLFDDTTVGGLSAISYDPGRQVYYVISDDRSEKDPARFYTVRITFSDNRLGSVEWVTHHTASGPHGCALRAAVAGRDAAGDSAGPGGHRRSTKAVSSLYWSSEGERIVRDPAHPLLLDPWVRVAGLDGAFRGAVRRCRALLHDVGAGHTGPRHEHDAGGAHPDAERAVRLCAAMEDPGYNDGDLPTPRRGRV